jgi:outer membrane protein
MQVTSFLAPRQVGRRVAPVIALSLVAAASAVAQEAPDSLHPITLDEAVRLAQREAPAAVQARGQVRASNSAVRSAYGAFLPNFQFTMGQSESRGRRQGPQGTLVDYVAPRSYSTGFNSSVTLFEGGRRFAELAQSRAEVGSAEANEVAQRFDIALQVKREYYDILAARESEAAARAQLEQAEAQLRAASARVRAGAATLSDSLRSVIEVGNARLALLTARNNVRESSAALSRLVATPYLVTSVPSDTLDLPLSRLPEGTSDGAHLRLTFDGEPSERTFKRAVKDRQSRADAAERVRKL